MTIRCIYTVQPAFPATDQAPDAQRVQIGAVWVDYTGATPTQTDVDAILSPSAASVDMTSLNATLAAPGSVVRGLALVVLDIAKGVIPINPSYTPQQLLTAIQQRMR